jgi:hypothetical protein
MLDKDEVISLAQEIRGFDSPNPSFMIFNLPTLVRFAKRCYAAGQRDMRERAAVAAWSRGMDFHKTVGDDAREVGSLAARDIRNLEIEEPT